MLKKIVAMTLVLAFVLAMIPASAGAFQVACDRYRTCITAFDCAWWGTRCAAVDMQEFLTITVNEWW